MKKRSIIKPIEDQKKAETTTQTRSLRRQNIVKADIQLINCHCCKTVDSAVNMITCSRIECRESFCINCIKKTYLKFNSNFFLILKEKENNNNWKCYKCVGKCPCKDCEYSRDKKPLKRMLKRKRKMSAKRSVAKSRRKIDKIEKESQKEKESLKLSRKRNDTSLNKSIRQVEKIESADKLNSQINNIKLDESKLRDTIKIDEFCIMEFESSDQEEDNNQANNIIPESQFKEKNISKTDEFFMSDISQDNKPFLLALLNDKKNNHELTLKNNNKNIKNDSGRKVQKIDNNINKSNSMNTINFFNAINAINTFNTFNSINSIINTQNISDSNENKINNCNIMDNYTNQNNSEINIENANPFSVTRDDKNTSVVNNINNNVNIFITNNTTVNGNNSSNNVTNQLVNTQTKKPLTKPCNVCAYSHFIKSEILKFNNINLIYTTVKEYIAKRETMIDEDFDIIRQQLHINNYVRNDENFEKNKIALAKIQIKEIEENFKRTKRICKKCLYSKLENEDGINIIFDSVHEEDEQATLDSIKKEEIIKNIKNFIWQNGYNLSHNYLSASTSEQTAQGENAGFNIFNYIFEKKKINDEEVKKLLQQSLKKKHLSKDNSYTVNHAESENQEKNIEKPLMYNFKLPETHDNLKFLNDNFNTQPVSQNPINNISKDLFFSICKISNQILFSNIYIRHQKNLIEKIFKTIEEYSDSYENFINDKYNQTEDLAKIYKKLKLAQNEINEPESNSIRIESEEYKKFCSDFEEFLLCQKKANESSCGLLKNLNTVMKDLKDQSELLIKNGIIDDQGEVLVKNVTNEESNNEKEQYIEEENVNLNSEDVSLSFTEEI